MTSAAPIQRQFDLRISSGRPMFSVNSVMGILDRSEDDVLNLIEVGLLRWAFDIRGPLARCAEWRVWRDSIVDYAASPIIPEHKLVDVIDSILPEPARPEVTRMQLCRAFNCSHTHITQLVNAGELLPVKDSGRVMPGRGVYGQTILRSSVAQFLRSRCVQTQGSTS